MSDVAKCFSWEALRREAAGKAAEVYAATSQLMAVLSEHAKYKGAQPLHPQRVVRPRRRRRRGSYFV